MIQKRVLFGVVSGMVGCTSLNVLGIRPHGIITLQMIHTFSAKLGKVGKLRRLWLTTVNSIHIKRFQIVDHWRMRRNLLFVEIIKAVFVYFSVRTAFESTKLLLRYFGSRWYVVIFYWHSPMVYGEWKNLRNREWGLFWMMYYWTPGPVFCLLPGVIADYAQPIIGQIIEITCPVIDQAQPEPTPNKRQKTGPGQDELDFVVSIASGWHLYKAGNQLLDR